MKNNHGIAIVGIDCRYPGADNVTQYWENILSLRQQFRRVPDKRLNLNYYASKDRSQVDYTYLKKASVLSNYHFDRVKYRVSKSTFEQTDMAHWIALDVAAGALKDAGFENGEGLDKKRVGVVLGNSLNGEFTRASVLRLRWPYIFKVMESTLDSMNYDPKEIAKILSSTEKVFKAPFPEPDADTLAGGLSNTIAGRICNYFDFNGGGFTIDGACSSSLLAFSSGCNSIVNGDLDVAIVGGVDVSIDPFEIIGFSRNGALAEHEMEVYSAKSQGFWPGEGCGIVVLMSEAEALDKGLNIYGVIRGWGISSDGKGGVTRPKPETQLMAMERAYARAGYSADTVALFEGHGTGTPLGDKVELTALVRVLRNSNKKNTPAVLGSVKHLIGHTKAAAGVAGVLKACLALKHGIAPASRLSSPIHTILKENESLIKLGRQPELWSGNTPMRASVSSMGFGGINVHLTMEEGSNARKAKRMPSKVKQLANSTRDCEVFPIVASSKEKLLQKVERLSILARDISRSEFIDLSATLTALPPQTGIWKASIVAKHPDDLLTNLTTLKTAIENGETKLFDVDHGLFFNATDKRAKIAFLFPGQGSPTYPNCGAFAPICKAISPLPAQRVALNGSIADTSIAQPIIVQNTLQTVDLLEHYGLEADCGIGHSLGEIAALAWANVMNDRQAIELANVRGKAMSEYGEAGGAMLALKCDEAVLQQLISENEVNVTGYNGIGNYVVGGAVNEINEVQQKAFEQEIKNVKLRVSHAFHTPMMKAAASEFLQVIKDWNFAKADKKIISTVTGLPLEEGTDLVNHLYTQIEQPVLFSQAIEQTTANIDLFVEVGPGHTLSKTLSTYKNIDVAAVDFGSASIRGFLNVLSAAFVTGHEIQFEELSTNRFYRNFDFEQWELDVLVNPCEKIKHDSSMIHSIIAAQSKAAKADATPNGQPRKAVVQEDSKEGVLHYFKNLISEKTEIPVDVIGDNDHIMSELHLNSLAITEIISLLTKAFNKSHKVFSAASIMANADGTISELSTLIFNGTSGSNVKVEKGKVAFEQVANWAHIFRRKAVLKKASRVKIDKGIGKIQVHGPSPLSNQWTTTLAEAQLSLGDGGIFVYHSENAAAKLHEFVDFLNQPEIRQGAFVALVNLQSDQTDGDLRPILRTFQQEMPGINTMSLSLDKNLEQPLDSLINELKVATSYREVVYTAAGERRESECEVFFPQAAKIQESLREGEVLLATGGGKGITFASIFALAEKTKVKLAILGRSQREQSEELSANLKRLDEAGIDYRYYAADVCCSESIQKTIAQITADLGPVRTIIHGAGINRPQPLHALSPEDFDRTAKVKVDGLGNVLNALPPGSLQLLIGYGSIIAESGMHGNADYAWANDQMGHYIERFAREQTQCRCLTLEWSIWDETGMGVSLNSIDQLKEKGVWPISVKRGVAILEQLIADQSCAGRYIISGRFGNIPTLKYIKHRLPIGRFIGKIKNHIPQVEVVSEVNVNLNDDVYLTNHVFQNQYVFPTVMILEGIAQVCSVLAQGKAQWTFDHLQIHKSIFIPKQASNIVRFIVTRIGLNEFKAVVQSEDSNFAVNCFETIVNFSTQSELTLNMDDCLDQSQLNFNVEEKFYDDLLFHHGPFRRIKSFLKIKALESLAEAESSLSDKWFGPYISENYLLGDPGLNDAAIHCHQACRPGGNLLPIAARQISINNEVTEGPFYIKTKETREIESDTYIDVYVVNRKGEVKEYWKDLVLTKVSGTEFKGQWDPHLLVAHIEYALMKLSNSRNVTLPLDQCMNLIGSIESEEHCDNFELNGYSISIKKRALTPKKKFASTKHLTEGYKQLNLPLDIANVAAPAMLQISQLRYKESKVK
ncbi:MAG: SDR family NAD(P)-dependent oxidoreductase [Bacteroidota bacterium]